MELELRGVKELVAALEKKRADVSGPGMVKALRAGGRVIQAAMASRAPVLNKTTAGSTALPPGTLKESIRVAVPRSVLPVEVHVGPSGRADVVGAWVEYGHRQVSGGHLKLLGNGKSRGKGKAGRDVPAHPWARPAFEVSVGEAEAAITAELKKAFGENS